MKKLTTESKKWKFSERKHTGLRFNDIPLSLAISMNTPDLGPQTWELKPRKS